MARPCPSWVWPVRPVPGLRENKCVWFSATKLAVTCDSSCRKGIQCPRNVQGEVLVAWPCWTIGWGLLRGAGASRALQSVQESVQAQVEEDSPEPVWGGLDLPLPSPILLLFGSRAALGARVTPRPPCREAERGSAVGHSAGPGLAHSHTTSGWTERACSSARASAAPSPSVTLCHRRLIVHPRPQPLVLGSALRLPGPRLCCPLACGRLVHPVLWLFLNIVSEGPI